MMPAVEYWIDMEYLMLDAASQAITISAVLMHLIMHGSATCQIGSCTNEWADMHVCCEM